MLETKTVTVRVREAHPAARVPVPAPEPFSRKFIFLILFVALLANAIIVLVALPEVRGPLSPTYNMGFGDLYDLIARNLDQGNGYRVEPNMGNTMLREPGYPLLLAAAFKVGGYGIQQARVVCVLLAFGAGLLLLRLTREITGDAVKALVATLLFLLYPGILLAEARAGIEIPSIFTMLFFMVVLYGAVEKESLWQYWAAGLLLGVAVLVRSEVLLFPILLLVYLLLRVRDWVQGCKAVASVVVLALGITVVMSPWVIRNYALVHEFVPTASVAGVAAQEGLYSCENAAPAESFSERQTRAGVERVEVATQLQKPFTGPYYQLFYTPHDEIAFNHALLNQVSTEYRSHPALLARCTAKNLFFNFWFLGKRQESTVLNVIMQTPLLGMAFGGVAVLRRRGLLHKSAIVLLYIFYVPFVHASIIAHARHSMLIVPFLAILASTALVSIWRGWRMQSSDARLATLE